MKIRWLWIRHAKTKIRKGVFVGKTNPPAAISSAQQEIAQIAAAIAKLIPLQNRSAQNQVVSAKHKKSARMGDRVPRELMPRGLLITSGLRRAIDTAEAISNSGNKNYQPIRKLKLAALNEQNFGLWEGEEYNLKKHKALWDDPVNYQPPEGESFAELCKRVARAIERIELALQAMAARQSDEASFENISEVTILAVVHAGSIRAAIAHALAITPEQAISFAIDNLSCTRIERYRDNSSEKTHSVIHCVNAKSREIEEWGDRRVGR